MVLCEAVFVCVSWKWKSAISSNKVLSIFVSNVGEDGTETFSKMKQVYGEHALSRSQVFNWHKASSEGRESIEDEPHSGRLSTSKTEDTVRSDRDSPHE
jgi:hypothetical protein